MPGFRNRDMQVERELAAFMDNHLYNDGQFTKHTRTDDRQSQLGGSDIILSIPRLNLENIVVDEKGQTQYLTKPLPTFSLELSFLRYNQVIPGWFIDDNKSTQYYMLIWPEARVNWNATEGDFTQAEYMLISKQTLREYFIHEGYDRDQLIAKANSIRNLGTTGQIDKREDKDYWFFFTPGDKLPEQPINIVVRKSIYRSLSIMSGFIQA